MPPGRRSVSLVVMSGMDPVRRKYLVITVVLMTLALALGAAVFADQVRRQGWGRAVGDASTAIMVSVGMSAAYRGRRRRR